MTNLDRDRWRIVSPHLDEALELPDGERTAWLARLRLRDPTLADEVQSLLDERGLASRESFLARPTHLLPPPGSLAGQTFGSYTLVSLIGQGGMGNVWLARRSDGRFEGEAAVKLLNASLVGRSGEERFRREGHILARLADPHIARLLDAGVAASGQPYLVLEYVEGQPIDAYCRDRALGVEQRLRLFLDVLEAVAHAHANLIVHRDIKPSNVLIDRAGHAKLLDFGIAKLLEGEGEDGSETALTREGGRALTPAFAAPEQVTGGAVTTATDVYALGTLLYLLLADRHPAGPSRQSPAELVRAIVDTEPARVSEAAPEARRRALEGDLDTIVAKALKKSPAERYASVTALADDVARYLERKPIAARPDTLAYRTAKFVRRHTGGVAAAAAAALLLVTVVGFYTTRLAKERDRARMQAQKATKVSELLKELLTAADPFEARSDQSREPTVRELLDAGAQRIEKDLAGEPDLQVEMLTLMGRIYQRLQLSEKARPLLQEALSIGRRSFGNSEPVASSLNELGVLLRETGDTPGAERALTEALAMRRSLLGENNADVAISMVDLADVYVGQGLDDRAEALFRESLAIRRKVLREGDHDIGVSLNDLALLLRRRGKLAESESLFRQALPIFRATMGPEHPHVADALSNLALVVADRGDYAASESLFRESLEIDRKTLGEDHPNTGNTLINLARPLLEEAKYDEAASAAERGLRITRASMGDDHLRLSYGEIYLGRADLARNQPEPAEPLLRDALRIRLRVFPADDWRIGAAKSELGGALIALGCTEEAEGLLLDAQRVLRNIPGAEAEEAEATRVRLADLDATRHRAPLVAGGPGAVPR